jgi:hypothetical protein
MAYDEKLVERIRRLLNDQKAVDEIKMFGGICFTLRGNMCCGTLKEDIVLRVGPDQYKKALLLPGARPMTFTGRSMKGFVFLGPKGYKTDASLKKAVALAVAFVATLPPKKG